jgi:iron complex transport system substrate-binding protein
VNSFEDVTAGLRKVGAITGKTEAGESEARKLEKKLSDILAQKPANGPTTLVVVAASQSQFVAGRQDSYLGSLLNLLGARNIITNEPETFRFPGFTDYSPERIVEKNPDVILAISPGRPNITTTALSASPVWSTLKAVQGKRVHEVDPVVYLEAAGPRVGLMLDELSRILYPDVFKAS